MRKVGRTPESLIEVLHTVQETFGYLDDDALTFVGASLGVPPSKVYGVASFYSFFTLKPQGDHTCVVCTGTACYINGVPKLLEAVAEELGVEAGGTTEDGRVSVLTARCIGACSLAPAVVVDGELVGTVTPESLVSTLSSLPAEEAS